MQTSDFLEKSEVLTFNNIVVAQKSVELFKQIQRIDIDGNLPISEHANLQKRRHEKPVRAAPVLIAIIPAEEA